MPAVAHKAITIKPKDGGLLATDVSANVVDVQNYRVKRDWRRYIDRELRREGYDYFTPYKGIIVITGGQSAGTYTGGPTTYTNAESGDLITLSSGVWYLSRGGGEVLGWALSGTFPYGTWNPINNTPAGTVTGAYGGNQSGPFDGPITLTHNATAPDGTTTTIIGTPTTLYRYYGSAQPYYIADPVPYCAGYVLDAVPGFVVIGSGFQRSGYRWEVLDLGPDIVFNNGVDLPVVYSLSDAMVTPLYEMRENGISAVGTIWEFNSTAMTGDVTQIIESAIAQVMANVVMPGFVQQVGANYSGPTKGLIQAGATLVQTGFNEPTQITGFVYPDGNPPNNYSNVAPRAVSVVPGNRYRYKPGGSDYSLINGSQIILNVAFQPVDFIAQGTTVLLTTASPFSTGITAQVFTVAAVFPDYGSFRFQNPAMVGAAIRFGSGFSTTIAALNPFNPQSTFATLADPAPFTLDEPFWVSNGPSDFYVTSTQPVFTADMVGKKIFWDSGYTRLIVAYINPTAVQVETDEPVPVGTWTMENPQAYGPIQNSQFTNRIGYRTFWSALNQARRYAAAVLCSMTAGTRTLNFAIPVRSFYAGQNVLVIGAGYLGGNLQANILSINAAGTVAVLDQVALTTVFSTDQLDSLGQVVQSASEVSASDMIGSQVAFEDLLEDASPIVRGLDLNGGLVLYRKTGYQLGSYTGDPTQAFAFSAMVPTSNAIFFKNTLTKVTLKGYEFHFFAGRNSFFRFDGISRLPIETLTSASYTWQQTGTTSGDINLCRRTFYQQAAISEAVVIAGSTYRRTDFIFAADNEMTREIFVCFPSNTQDQAICFDYENGTISTTSGAFTAATTIFNPMDVTQKWFIMGTASGMVLQYGKADLLQPGWTVLNWPDGTQYAAMFNRLGQPYTSELRSGLGGFNAAQSEKNLQNYLLEMSSLSGDVNVTVNLYGATNPNDASPNNDLRSERLLGSQVLNANDNLIPCHFEEYYFSDQILCTGMNNPCEISARTFYIAVLRTEGLTKIAGI